MKTNSMIMETKMDNTDELALSLRREYHRKWRREHREKVREYNERYWKHKAELLLEKEESDDVGV